MATTCPKCDPKFFAVCDFCQHYTFNADDTGDGWCGLHQRPEDPASGCNDFHCMHATQEPDHD